MYIQVKIELKIENVTLIKNACTLNFWHGVVCHTICTYELI